MMRSIACSLLLLVTTVTGCCCPPVTAAREAAKRAHSANNMHILGIAMANYRARNGAWPKTLEEIEPYTAEGFGELLANPVTGDNPGYEYVPPVDSPDAAEAIVLYQLRDGQRDMSLDVLYGDGHVGPVGETP